MTEASCPRCAGQVYLDSDQYGQRTVCLQCGHSIDLTTGGERWVPIVPITREPGRRDPRVGTGMGDAAFERWAARARQRPAVG